MTAWVDELGDAPVAVRFSEDKSAFTVITGFANGNTPLLQFGWDAADSRRTLN